MSHTNRVILLIDMDCFYCQVEQNLDPSLKGKPLAVVQYNQWRGGGIIAVNYEARARGVTRHMRGADAKEQCPEIILAKVPTIRDKADLTRYRDAGKKVANVLQTFSPCLQRASVDEAYMDITSVVEKRIQEKNDQITIDKLANTFVVGSPTEDFIENVIRDRAFNESNFKLAIGGVIAEEIRAEVFKVTGYRCSAGVAHNKILAKLVCGLHKPNKQTILPHEAVPKFYEDLPVKKIQGLGGKFGNAVKEKLGIEFMGELFRFNKKELAKKFDDKSACWLYNIARGIDTEPVNTRLISKSIGSSKNFRGKTALCTQEDVEYWVNELAEDIFERLEKDFEENNRKGRLMTVTFTQAIWNEETSGAKSHPLDSYEKKKIYDNALRILQKSCMRDDGSYHITLLGISVGNFQDVKNVKEITSFFKNMKENANKSKLGKIADTVPEASNQPEEAKPKFKSENKSFMEKFINNGESIRKQENDGKNNSSIFSQTTEENSDVDDDNLVYYEQVHPESIANQNFTFEDIGTKVSAVEVNDESDESIDSITPEVDANIDQRSNAEENEEAPKSSFFSRYFGIVSNRSFNTSKPLDNSDISDGRQSLNTNDSNLTSSDVMGVDVSEQEISNISSDKSRVSDNFNNASVSAETNITCDQCGKSFNHLDYESHLDYHFAISIVKNEAHLYKNEPNIATEAKQNKSNAKSPCKIGAKKRKKDMANTAPSKPIENYFKATQTETRESEAGEICDDCGKRILFSEWDVHRDFHAAKRLHLEMNAKQFPTKPLVKQKPAKSSVKGQKSLLGFLKS